MNEEGVILIADDDAGARAYVSALLEEAGYATRCAADGEEVLALARETRPALVLLDVEMPRLSGYEACRRLRDLFGDGLPIAFVSGSRTESYDRAGGLLVGADDYIVKPFAPDEFLARIRALLRRARAADGLPTPAGVAGLTPRELEVLALLADGLSQSEIAGRLVISPKTVGTHTERIFRKLGVNSRARAIARAYRERLIA